MQPSSSYEMNKLQQQQGNQKGNHNSYEKCPKCTTRHEFGKCPARMWNCFKCGKKGHSAKACFARSYYKNQHGDSSQHGNSRLNEMDFKLATINWVITGSRVEVLGEISVMVNNENMPLLVVDSPRPFKPLLGRNWMDILYPTWRSFFAGHIGVRRDSLYKEHLPEQYDGGTEI
ncbi:uncharacterized protein LOC142226153 [Haematobia irritans]|uniref:uncharacterized protein LOC142226153 n=1 Tax=Haematobia irritans TaxID=7368 RepID=UPI003F4F8065